MAINIGELWDGPIPIADGRQCLPSIYSDTVSSEIFPSYNIKAYQDYDSISSKCLSPESKFGSHAEYSLRDCNDMNDEEEISSKEHPKRSFLMNQHGFIREVSTELSERGKDDVSAVDIQRSENTICRHASKALRVRSCAAKDRHSKVNTAKGLRDTRVRLSLSTAVRFYEVQYRLGFHRPSKTLDWLMTKAETAIDQLPEPSYISNLNCSLCRSVSKGSYSLSTDPLISTYSHTKPRCSEQTLDLT